MACLQYNPSVVTYRKQQFTREFLMRMRQILLDKCKEMVDDKELAPFKDQGLNTDKVFADLLAYFKDRQSQEYKSMILKASTGGGSTLAGS
jgi:hypothetical protein